jgi:DNA (cytosine-5)-methyltransferase 1
VGSLFAGIGGFDLGFERAGFKTVWQVEINEYCRKVLARHFPDAERYADIRECGAHNLKPVDVICGGFPCQDISNAGLRAGIDGERSGLWFHMHRVIRELRPRFVVVENVAALLGRGMGRVLGDLSEIGYDAEWQIISAADVGAPHLRERIWVVAYPKRDRLQAGGSGRDSGDAEVRIRREREGLLQAPEIAGGGSDKDELAHSASVGCEGSGQPAIWGDSTPACEGETNHAFAVSIGNQWSVEPNVGRVAHGVPARVDRLRALGNAVVPQIPELIARRLQEVMA